VPELSRLDSFIRRLQAQRSCLDAAAALIASTPGPALEIGLGNGRTYDHLRERLAGRAIFVFDRQVATHPDSTPPPKSLFIGDVRKTLAGAAGRIGAPAALAHVDIGSGDEAANAALAAAIAPSLVALMAPGGVIVSDQPLAHAGLDRLALPSGVKPGRYHMYVIGPAVRRDPGSPARGRKDRPSRALRARR
jgi:hypothetical protein